MLLEGAKKQGSTAHILDPDEEEAEDREETDTCLAPFLLSMLGTAHRFATISLITRTCTDCYFQRANSMLTFEGSQVQGAQAIVEKLTVRPNPPLLPLLSDLSSHA